MTKDDELIVKVIQDFKKERDAIESQIIDLCYNMNGGVTWESAWSVPQYMREKMIKYINKALRDRSGSNKEFM